MAICLICWRQSSQLFEKSCLTLSIFDAPTPMVCCQVTEEKRSANKVELRRRPFKESDTLQDNAYDVVVSCFSTLEHQNCGCFMIL